MCFRLRLLALLLLSVVLSACSLIFDSDDDANDLPADSYAETEASLSRVIDGDSLELGIGGTIEEFRLRGVNAPEKRECGGEHATDGLAELLAGKSLTVDLDLEEPRDRFGRLLGEIRADDLDISTQLVELGLVFPLGGSTSIHHEGALRASDAGLGVWNPDQCGTGLRLLGIAAFVPDPAGSDSEEGAGEFIELENISTVDVSLAGWMVRDESTSNVYEFDGGALAPGERVRLYSTCGDEDGQTRFWCSSSPVWSNIGDTALVLDPAGNTIDFRFSP